MHMTEYVVRSSDWRSAVCSSDLVLALLKADCGGSVSGPGRRQILITRCGSGERINRSGLAGRFCCLRRVFLGGCRQRPEQRGSTQQTRSDPGPARSEEHTSELQSLMRISYAVFCLKKKKISHIHGVTQYFVN